jgi:hypothetical protein
MFYVIETTYVGPNDLPNADRIVIAEEPVTGATSRQPVVDGWAGSFNNYSYTGLGAYETLEEARAAVDSMLGGECREVEANPDEVEAYAPGKFAKMTLQEAVDWIAAGEYNLVASSDEDLTDLAEELEEDANNHDGSLGDHGLEALKLLRDAQ